MTIYIGSIAWHTGKLRKLCGECAEPMRLVDHESVAVLDPLPPIYPYDWTCKNDHIERAGTLSDANADELRRIFESD